MMQGVYGQAATPTKAPTPDVSAMASAPQKVTRIAEVNTGAPPARAASEPSSARNNSELADTTHISADTGTKTTTSRGSAAPTEKVPADAKAA
jgi:hypothetical protein